MTSMILPRFWLLLCCLLAACPFARAQSTVEKAPPQLLEKAPATGTFYMLGRIPSPPYPFDPYRGALPIYAYDGVFFVDDTAVSFLAEDFAFSALPQNGESGGGMMMAMSAPSLPGGFSGTNNPTNLFCQSLTNFTVDYLYATNGLTLGIAQTTNPWIALSIHTATINQSYDVFGTTNLTDTATNLNRTNWVWLARISGGTTNFIWGLTNWCERYFQLGTMTDDDLDGLTTAYEILVSHTKWEAGDGWDSDGDGLSDDFELRHSQTDPNNPDTGATGTPDGYKDADGDGWTHLDEMRNNTNPLVFNTPAAPPSVAVNLLPGQTNAIITWSPANGPVTGYVVRDQYGDVVATVGASTNQVQVEVSTAWPWPVNIPSYSVQAIYEDGESEPSELDEPGDPQLTIDFHLVRGPGGQPTFVASGLDANMESISFFWNSDLVGPLSETTVARTNFINGVWAAPFNAMTDATYFWARAITTNGQVGPVCYFGRTLPPNWSDDNFHYRSFTDTRQVLSDNLRFLVRASTRTEAFTYWHGQYFNPFVTFSQRVLASGGYEVSGYHELHDDIFGEYYTLLAPTRPLIENFLWRNFIFDSGLFSNDGTFQTGAHAYDHYNGNSRALTNVLFAFDGTNTASQLGTNEAVAIFYTRLNGTTNAYNDERLSEASMTGTISGSALNWTLLNGATNYFGLPIDAVDLANSEEPAPTLFHLAPGQSADVINYGGQIFLNVRQPVFATESYYFSQPAPDDGLTYTPSVPGEWDFTPTNTTPLLLAAVGEPFYLSGWAKKIITNGDTNKPAYLEQFFDKAFKADVNGNATTNETGILSEFGEFFPTEPGPVLLTTKPDIETAEVGQALVHVISLNVDANHDGEMDRTFAGPDTTSAQRPFRFWLNHDFDSPDGELKRGVQNSFDMVVNGVRDLEDFARLHISGVPTLPQGCTATLSWDGTGALKLYNAYETNGGIGYLTNVSAVSFQSAYVNTNGGAQGFGAAIAVLSSVTTHTFSTSVFSNGLPRYFLFEGLQAGDGELVLTIEREGQQIARASVFIEMVPITDMYERAQIKGVYATHPAMRDDTNASTFQVEQRLAPQPGETKQLVVYVHGFRNDYNQFKIYAETMFKRLYWQGYRGRFAGINWPTLLKLTEYNQSEYIAFRSAAGAAALFTELRLRFPDYSINVGAHSMGNIVMMETLKLHLAASRQDINNYVLMEGAVPAQCYDANVSEFDDFLIAEQIAQTPNTYQLYPGNIQNALRGSMFNFFSELDFALGPFSWLEQQIALKPAILYNYANNTAVYYRFPSLQQVIVTDSRELMAFVARPRTKAVGAQTGVEGIIEEAVDLQSEFGFGGSVGDHSGQFTRDGHEVRGFYRAFLQRCDIIVP